MTWKPFSIAIACLTMLFVMAHNTHAQDKITGPWLWMIAPTEPGRGGAASIDIDSLAVASNGAVTEADVAANGANEGGRVGNFRWTLGKIAATGSDNINDCLNRIGMAAGNVDDHSAYALFMFESDTARNNATMRVGSDDAIKVWLNGKVVYNNPIDRGASDFQDTFRVDLVAGDNLLMVKVSERGGGWSMFVGIDTIDGGDDEWEPEQDDNEWDREPDIEPSVQSPLHRSMVRLIYILPSDRVPEPGIDAKIIRIVKEAQQFFANEMERHGFGRKTFLIETDATGTPLVHHINNGGQIHQLNQPIRESIYSFIVDSQQKGCGFGGPYGFSSGYATIYYEDGACLNWSVAAHELGHAFGLPHDFRDDTYLMSYGGARHIRSEQLSKCNAEWLDVHRAFNPGQPPIDRDAPTTVKMLPPSLVSPPNTIRLRFEITDPDGIHQAQLYNDSGLLQSCKRLNGKTHSTIEFTTNNLPFSNRAGWKPEIGLRVIDVHGNWNGNMDVKGVLGHPNTIDMDALMPPPEVVSIPDAELDLMVRIHGLAPQYSPYRSPLKPITTHAMLDLKTLNASNRGITDLTGLEHAHNLQSLNLGSEYIQGQGAVNRNAISDFSPLKGLTQLQLLDLDSIVIFDAARVSILLELPSLRHLYLSSTSISDVSTLAELTQLIGLTLGNNPISDVSPLAGLTQLRRLDLSNTRITDVSALTELVHLTELDLRSTPLTDVSSLAALTQLKALYLFNTSISDVSALSGLTELTALGISGTTISDISPISALTQLTYLALIYNSITDVSHLVRLDSLETLYIQGNPLNYASINTHIPAMQARGIEVTFDSRTPATLTKRLGDVQQAKSNGALAIPLVVEVEDEKGVPFAGVSVTFTITAGGGKLNTTTTATDTTGRAQTTLTLGPRLGTNTVRATAAEIQQPVTFTATATDNPPPTFRKPIIFSVAENTTDIGTVRATDVDTQDRVTGYTISPTAGEDSAKFSITPTGVLRFKLPPDYERPTTAARTNEYIVLVSATGGTGERARTGTQPFTITVTDVEEPPDTPAVPTVIPATPTSLIVSWAAPANTGPPMTYQVRYRVGNTGRFTDANYNGAQTSFTLNDLRRGKRYQVQVRAKNDEGTSAWSPSGSGIPQTSPPIDFADAVLRAKIAEALGNQASNPSITPVDMLALTKLEAPNAAIRNLAGLEHAHNLTTLNLGGAYVDGEGWVNRNKISDYSPLTGLTQLSVLNLSFNALTDVSFLPGLTQLRTLHLSNNTISDVSPLANLTQLISLQLSGNAVSDVSSLAGLIQLISLNLSYMPLTDVSSLAGLAQLRVLYLFGTSLTDVSALTGLTQLTQLSISGASALDVSPLAGLTQLTNLQLGGNGITDVAALAGLTELLVLNLRGNAILDVVPLVRLALPGTQWDSTGLFLEGNPLSYASINTHIPAMQAKGVAVQFDPRIPTTLVKISGTEQQGTINTPLPLPFVVEVRDQQNRAFAGVPVTFNITAGDSRLRTTSTTTDVTGRAEAHLTLGRTTGTTTVRTTAAHISQPVQFTATVVLLSSPVAIPHPNLRAQILATLGKPRDSTLTMSDMLKLTVLNANSTNIRDLTGLQHATNLTTVLLNDNHLADVATLAGLPELKTLLLDNNNLSDVEPLALLTEVETLSLNSNRISNVAALSALTHLKTLLLNNNTVSDVEPLTRLAELKTLQLRGNPLSYPSLHTHIPTIQSGGTTVTYDPRIPSTLVKLSGTHGVAGESLWLIVEVQDAEGFGFAGVPVSFTVAAGGGSLSPSNVITNVAGRAQTYLTLGATPGKNTVSVAAAEVSQSIRFTITAINAASPVTIRDANLRAKITETLGKARGVQLTAGDMLALTRLDARNTHIQNLTGLEHAHNLRELNLGSEYIQGQGHVNSNKVSDFSPLFDLTQLSVLNLSFSSIPDTSLLLSLTQVKNLHLGNNNLSDISALSRLTQLTSLTLWNNAITDLMPLSDLTQLTSLHLANNTITDVAPLASLTQLTSLSLQGNVITDVAPLANLTQLTHLDLSYMSVSDVSSLAGLVQLRTLYLYNTSLSDVSALSGLTQLTHLGITGTSVSDVSLLAGLTQLAYLHLGNNVISDIAALSGLTQLKTLYLLNNAISDVSVLSGLAQLEVLNLSSNAILDVSPLVGLDLPGTQWNSTGLYIERNPLNYASVHTHIPAMQARGVEVKFDNRAHSALVKISGDMQESEARTTLATPFVVEALDPHGTAITGLSVTFRVIEGSGSLSATTATTDARGRARAILTLGPDPGVNKVRGTAPQITYPVTFTAIATGAARLAADVNGDGMVNIQDLVLVSSNFGQTGENHADVNGDGAVNIQDLVLVAGAFGEGAAAAPALHPSVLAKLSMQDVQQWLDDAKHLGKTDAAHLRGIAVLEQLLALLLPKEMALSPNYPNPFNPETWIPYQLAQPTEVTLHIYAVNGALIRVLALGHQPAGVYHTKSRAAYWDGRNEQGERVASGVYFYMLTAGDFSATRKLLIRK